MKKWLVALLLLLWPASALAADYSIPNYRMQVSLSPDGSADITETLVYAFDGEYNGIRSTIDIGDTGGLSDLRLFVDDGVELTEVSTMNYEPYTYTADVQRDLLYVKAYAPGRDGRRTFTYTYHMAGLVTRYRDAARLNYKLIGVGNEETLQNASLEITCPQDGGVLDAWAHGAVLTGGLTIERGSVKTRTFSVEPGQFAELDVLMNADGFADAPYRDEAIVDAVRTQEAAILAREADAQARAERQFRLFQGIAAGLSALFVAAMGLWVVRLKARYGFKTKLPPPSDLHALDGMTAALAGYIWSGDVDEGALSGTLLDLVKRGALEMQPKEQVNEALGMGFRRVAGFSETIPHEQRYLLDWLFPNDAWQYVGDFGAGSDYTRAQRFIKRYEKFKELVEETVEQSGDVFRNGGSRIGGLVVALVGAFVFIALCAFAQLYLVIACLLLAGIVLAVLFAKLRRLTDSGEEKRNALCYLKSMAQGKAEMPKEVLAYAPLAVAIGCIEPLVERIQDDSDDRWIYPSWMYYGSYGYYGRMYHDFRDVRSHNAGVPDPNAKSSGSSSSGGGFSSGGGGGGGGHGAW